MKIKPHTYLPLQCFQQWMMLPVSHLEKVGELESPSWLPCPAPSSWPVDSYCDPMLAARPLLPCLAKCHTVCLLSCLSSGWLLPSLVAASVVHTHLASCSRLFSGLPQEIVQVFKTNKTGAQSSTKAYPSLFLLLLCEIPFCGWTRPSCLPAFAQSVSPMSQTNTCLFRFLWKLHFSQDLFPDQISAWSFSARAF